MSTQPNSQLGSLRPLSHFSLRPDDRMTGLIVPVLPTLFDPGLHPAFLSPGGGEFILIMLILILLFGAKDAPRIFRTLHTMLDKVQRTASSFRYRIMYGDLFQDTGSSTEEPYDVEEQSANKNPEPEKKKQDTETTRPKSEPPN